MKEVECVSPRVKEVQELAKLLEVNGMSPMGALRSSVECVYDMSDRYQRHNYEGVVNRELQNDDEWRKLATTPECL